MSKRPLDSGSSGRGYGDMEFVPLGAGNEVGRSCGVLRYKGKTVMLDCGIHPGKTSYESLPIFDSVNLEEVDLLLVTHFHLDHAGALPYLFTEHIKFQGRIFMTHPTKAVLKMMIYDSIRVGFDEESLYTEDDMDRCFRKIEIIDFNQTLEVDGIKFTCYNAGHVLGGAMFAVDIAGVNVLYTGDYSLEEDRHLSPAAIPNQKKTDVLIVESTSGLNEHEDAVRREKRFLAHVEKVLKRGGRLLIPVFALGRAQELLLMMEEHWRDHPELQRYPIFYASKMAARALKVYHTYVNMMNAKVRATLTVRNPFKFDHITNLPFSNYDDDEPAVVLASPGMLQSGVSRKLCERWCGNPLNSVLIPGYAVDGTLAKTMIGKPDNIVSQSGRVLPRRCDVEYVSFSAHADYLQTRSFIRQLRPNHVVLVHGAEKEMKRMAIRLKTMLINEREDDRVRVDTPRNTQRIFFEFLQTKVAKVIGQMAEECESAEMSARIGSGADVASNRTIIKIKGILVNQNFSHKILSTNDMKTYTDLTVNKIQQKLHVPFWNNFELVEYFLGQVFDHVERIDNNSQRITKSSKTTEEDEAVLVEHVIKVVRKKPDRILLSWNASPTNDMIADACVAVVRSAETGSASVQLTSKICSCGHGGGTNAGGALPGKEKLTLQECQLDLENGMRNVLRFTFDEIAVDLVELVNEEKEDMHFDTALTVVADGKSAAVKCVLQPEKDMFKSVVIEDCDDENLKKTLLRVVMNVMGVTKVRPDV